MHQTAGSRNAKPLPDGGIVWQSTTVLCAVHRGQIVERALQVLTLFHRRLGILVASAPIVDHELKLALTVCCRRCC
jgi:hypothetical protein